MQGSLRVGPPSVPIRLSTLINLKFIQSVKGFDEPILLKLGLNRLLNNPGYSRGNWHNFKEK